MKKDCLETSVEMSLMSFMETMSTGNIPIVAAFFIGIMMSISPCPLATNITAIAYVSRKIDNSKHTLLVGFSYALGRMFSYTVIASSIVFFGLKVQAISIPLQKYGGVLIGPFLIVIGIIMLDLVKINYFRGNDRLTSFGERLSEKGILGSFLLGAIFALTFCPFSAVLFFGMLIPLSLKTGDGLILPSVFALATGLPVIIFSLILVFSISKLGAIMNNIRIFEIWTRKIVSFVFIGTGVYYVINNIMVI
ncbi:MAG TPA: aromatic aminobenezylarsenical efflux permease ArsG family transporter [Candidatus Nanoarchaeia archaeon]|nr:aromatic aminobenezylarsenical efflux permease ArsG family transporter [Candidatus Nanoarchaeia archaeon]